jgi:hypothetical protein
MHGARGGAPEGKRNGQLPARRQNEGNDRGLEAHKITALTSVRGKHRSIRRRQSQRAPGIREQPRPKADKDRSGFLQRKFILKPISPVANPCCNRSIKLMWLCQECWP